MNQNPGRLGIVSRDRYYWRPGEDVLHIKEIIYEVKGAS
jgi:hypothetical protein